VRTQSVMMALCSEAGLRSFEMVIQHTPRLLVALCALSKTYPLRLVYPRPQPPSARRFYTSRIRTLTTNPDCRGGRSCMATGPQGSGVGYRRSAGSATHNTGAAGRSPTTSNSCSAGWTAPLFPTSEPKRSPHRRSCETGTYRFQRTYAVRGLGRLLCRTVRVLKNPALHAYHRRRRCRCCRRRHRPDAAPARQMRPPRRLRRGRATRGARRRHLR